MNGNRVRAGDRNRGRLKTVDYSEYQVYLVAFYLTKQKEICVPTSLGNLNVLRVGYVHGYQVHLVHQVPIRQ